MCGKKNSVGTKNVEAFQYYLTDHASLSGIIITKSYKVLCKSSHLRTPHWSATINLWGPTALLVWLHGVCAFIVIMLAKDKRRLR